MTDQNQLLLRARVQDLMHLLSFAEIVTPTPGDKPEAVKAMADIRRLLPAPAQPQGAGEVTVSIDLIRRAQQAINYHLEPNSPDEHEATMVELHAIGWPDDFPPATQASNPVA
jgi:hypothetical protein